MHLDVRKLCALVLLSASLLSIPTAQAANYYVGNDAACTHNRLATAVLSAALAQDANPRFFVSKSKPTENAEVIFNYNNLSTVEVRGGFNSCQDAINGVTPTGHSMIESNAFAVWANRRVMRIGGNNSTPTVTLFDVIISGGRLDNISAPDGYGAGILVERGLLQLVRTIVENNRNDTAHANARGGGIALLSSSSTLGLGVGSIIRHNTAFEGGGIFCTTNANLLFEGAEVRNNEAVRRGGGISVRNGCTAALASGSQSGRIVDNELIGTLADNDAGGAGLYVGPGGNAIVSGTSGIRFQINGNSGRYLGGGAFVSGTNARLTTNWVDLDNNDSSSGRGGGLACTLAGTSEAAVVTRNTRIRNNSAPLGGGVFARNNCRIDVEGGTQISGNSTTFGDGGGGVLADAWGANTDAIINLIGGSSSVTVSNNQALNGGGVGARANGSGGQAIVNLENAVVISNSASTAGGGLWASGFGAEIVMHRTLAGDTCHSPIYCSDLSFNTISGADPLLGAGAMVRENGRLTIEGTYVEANQGTAVRAIDANFDSPSGFLRVQSSVLIPHQNHRLVRVTRSRAFLLFNTFGYDNINSRPIAITEGNTATRATTIFGNIFDGNLAPVDVSNINWVHVFNGCSSFRQAHIGDPFYSAHAAARRLTGQVALQPGSYFLSDPTSPVIDFCDGDAIALVSPPETDIAGLSRPFNTPNPTVHGPWDLGAHEIRTGAFYTLTAARFGEGSLVSNPAGINCPGTCDASFPENTGVAVTATAEPGWRFTNWELGCTGNNPVCNVVMDQNRSVIARFRQEFNLNIFLVGSGSVNIQPVNITCDSNCTHVFVDGTQLVLVADPAPGFSFAGWTGACSGLGACELTMSTNRSVAAEFVAGPGPDQIFRDRFEP